MARIQAGITMRLAVSRWTQGQLTYIFPWVSHCAPGRIQGFIGPRTLETLSLLECEELLL